ncbi:xanthine dehydrogenase accessory protein XdhC [Shimia sp.]|uniref:xanthine dehydrogenase accessory protein XdhC n=1 Tax=Shimia sp. TaxID=1954381 RepID=UPI0035619681
MRATDFAVFLARQAALVEARLTRVEGSSPRDAGAVMHVAPEALFGTIGGGRLEHEVIARARAMLGSGDTGDTGDTGATLEITLGPDSGQCCGGRVRVELRAMAPADREAALARMRRAEAAWPQVLVLGAGHVGRALADLLQHLPVRCRLIDSRTEELARCGARVETRLSALPEAEIAAAPAGSAYIVLTHDHGLDFLLVAAALGRGDAAYVGMIGSATKRARLQSWCRATGTGLSLDGLTCPIGAGGVTGGGGGGDKRPEVIALQVAAEVMAALGGAAAGRTTADASSA